MALSVFDLFKIGIGPSSSHTVGPMIAADRFARGLAQEATLDSTRRVAVELFGSLGATGKGHGSIPAVALGLMGERPDAVDPARTPERSPPSPTPDSCRCLASIRSRSTWPTTSCCTATSRPDSIPTPWCFGPTTTPARCWRSGRSTPSAAASFSTTRKSPTVTTPS
jgi:hypothetical protein